MLLQVLCAKNYSSRFSTLLHLEEIQQDVEMHEYDLDHVGVVFSLLFEKLHLKLSALLLLLH